MRHQNTLRWTGILGPGLIAGLFETLRHIYLDPWVSHAYGNIITTVLVVAASALLLTQIFRLMDRAENDLRLQQARNSVLQERDRIARDLHDGMSQTLFFLNVKVRQIEAAMDDPDRRKAREHLGELNKVMSEMYERIRQTIFDLKATNDLEEPDFCTAVRRYIEDFADRSGLTVDVRELSHTCRLDCPEAEMHFLRILQEALVNAHRHSGAERVAVAVRSDPDRGDFLQIDDDGRGFEVERTPGAQEGHFGLEMMRERARQLGGRLRIDSRPGRGTVVTFQRSPSDREGRRRP